MIEPRLGGFELVTLAEDFAGRLVEEPHAFVGASGERERDGKEDE